MNDLFLNALHCKNEKRAPLWLMRQAGRYLPEYQKLRQKHSLWELFHTPELAVEVTLQPLRRFSLDAAIVFSDILVIAEALGMTIHFPEQGGPKVSGNASRSNIEVDGALSYVKKTIALLKKELKVPLIGFCGGPFTVTRYFLEKPANLHPLLEQLTAASIAYLRMQVDAGVDALQIFDSWAGTLGPAEFADFSLRYLDKIIRALEPTGIPIILFCRGASKYPDQLSALSPRAISFDADSPLALLRKQVPSTIAVQGNLDPLVLQEGGEALEKAATELIASMQGEKGFICNLAHGVLPGTPPAHIHRLIDLLR